MSFGRAAAWRDDETLARAMIAAAPGSAVGYNNLGKAILSRPGGLDRSRFQEAEPYFAEAVRIYPEYQGALANLGIALSEQGRHREAVPPLERVLALRPDYPGAHFILGMACFQIRRDAEALAHLAEALRQDPDDARLLIDYGGILEAIGRNREARPILLRAVDRAPEDPRALFNLVLVELNLGLAQEAAPRVERLLRWLPRDPGVLVLHGRLLARSADAAAAEAAIREALAIDPAYAEGWYRLAEVLRGQGDAAAGAALARAAELGHPRLADPPGSSEDN